MRSSGFGDALRATAVSLLLLHAAANGQVKYPSHPIQLVVGTSAGGPTDAFVRAVATPLGKRLAQPVVVVNKDGAGGLIAGSTVAKSPPDGYTLLAGSTSSSVLAPMVNRSNPGFRQSDLRPIALLGAAPNVLFVNNQVPAKSVADLIKLLKQHGKKYSYASAGIGSITNVAGELFKQRVGADMLHVPYKGGGALTQSVMAGDTDIGFLPMAGVIQLHRAGKLRILAVLGPKRSALAPEIPTAEEAGISGVSAVMNFYLFSQAQVGDDVANVLRDAVNQVLASPEFQAQAAELQIDLYGPMAFEAVRQVFQTEVEQWHAVVQKANIRAD